MPRRRRTTATVTPPAAAGDAPDTPIVVAEAKASVRTNVARAWHRALENMGVGQRGTAKVNAKHERPAVPVRGVPGVGGVGSVGLRDDGGSREAWTLDASVVDVAVVDVSASAVRAEADHSESGIYAFGPLGLSDVQGMDEVAELPDPPSDAVRAVTEVTLIVYGWSNVEPGTLSWVFPTLRAALSAARTMKNAVRWAILSGSHDPEAEHPFDVTAARATGHVLVEASG